LDLGFKNGLYPGISAQNIYIQATILRPFPKNVIIIHEEKFSVEVNGMILTMMNDSNFHGLVWSSNWK
jgi:hypothetical protein